MTLLIGAHLRCYTILAADTRGYFRAPWGDIHLDQQHKIVLCRAGLLTASGYIDAIDAVKNELLSREIGNTNDIVRVIREKAIPKIETAKQLFPDLESSASFLLSYFTSMDGKDVLRLGLIHREWNYNLGLLDDSFVSMPYDAAKGDADAYQSRLTRGLVRLDGDESDKEKFKEAFSHSFTENIRLIATCFDEVSSKSCKVSRDMDFAAMLWNGNVWYGYGQASEMMNCRFRMSMIPAGGEPRHLTPRIFDEAPANE